MVDFDTMLLFLEKLEERFNEIFHSDMKSLSPHRLMLLLTDEIKPLEFETREHLVSFHKTLPLLVKITEKCWIKDMIYNRFREELRIK